MGKRKDGEPQQIANAGSRIALLGDSSQPEVLSSHLESSLRNTVMLKLTQKID